MTASKTFFSYAREDSEFAKQLATDLRKAGADIWMDQLDIRAGSRWDVEIEKALQLGECLLVILTPDSVSSHNVSDEISYAFDENKTVIPVLFKECKIPFRLRRLQYADFTKDYEKGFTELVMALNLTIAVPVKKKEPEDIISSKPAASVKKPEKGNMQGDLSQNKKELKKQTNKKEKVDTVVNPKNNLISNDQNDEQKVLVKFEDVYFSLNRKEDNGGLGQLYVRNNSLEYKSGPGFEKDGKFVIRDIVQVEFLPQAGDIINNYIKVVYRKDNNLSEIYFQRNTFWGLIMDTPTLSMFNQIQELITKKKFILFKK